MIPVTILFQRSSEKTAGQPDLLQQLDAGEKQALLIKLLAEFPEMATMLKSLAQAMPVVQKVILMEKKENSQDIAKASSPTADTKKSKEAVQTKRNFASKYNLAIENLPPV